MWQDPLVAEIHQIREEIAQTYGNDIHAICEAARRGELSIPPSIQPGGAAQQGAPADVPASASQRQKHG
jgi:hypothetical protein